MYYALHIVRHKSQINIIQLILILEGMQNVYVKYNNLTRNPHEHHTPSRSHGPQPWRHCQAHSSARTAPPTGHDQKPPRIFYPSLQRAVKARMQTATNFPGQQYLSETAATEMVLRSSKFSGASSNSNSTSCPLQFIHDPRLQWPSAKYFTDEQVEAVYRDNQCTTALLLSVDGWPFDNVKHERTLDILQPTVFRTLPGSHHFHADPDTADAVVAEVAAFLQAP
jgi:hypothetical protein